jgi:hypothetical protein
MNRRDALKGLAGMTIGTASCVLLPARERPQKPDKLERGQVWRTEDGWTCFVSQAEKDVRMEWFGPTPEHGSSSGFYHTENALILKCVRDHWTYLGNIRELPLA